MRALRPWLWGFVLLIVFVATLGLIALWRDLSTMWNAEQSAAQIALDKTPLSHLTEHKVYSGPGGVEDVFTGTNPFLKPGYAFVRLNPEEVLYVPYGDILNARAALSYARRYVQNPVSAVPGWLNASAAADLHTTSRLVWEITYRTSAQYGYLYLDAQTGDKLYVDAEDVPSQWK